MCSGCGGSRRRRTLSASSWRAWHLHQACPAPSWCVLEPYQVLETKGFGDAEELLQNPLTSFKLPAPTNLTQIKSQTDLSWPYTMPTISSTTSELTPAMTTCRILPRLLKRGIFSAMRKLWTGCWPPCSSTRTASACEVRGMRLYEKGRGLEHWLICLSIESP